MVDHQTPREWAEAGIIGETRLVRLMYNKPANLIVAQFHRETSTDSVLSSLYVRHPDETQYRRLTDASERLSYEDPVVAASAPTLFANVLEWEGDGADWRRVICFDLLNGASPQVFAQTDISLRDPYTQAWVSSLHEARPDGRSVVCTIGCERPATDADKRRHRDIYGADILTTADHWLCELNLAGKSYERIALLSATFF